MAHLAGKSGDVFYGSLLIDDCEDAWDESVDADVTESADATDYKVGAASAKFVCADGLGAGDIIATEDVAVDLSTYDRVMFWFKSSVALDAGDIQMLFDDTADCASPIVLADIPAIGAGAWTLVTLDEDFSGCGAIISIGLKQIVDKGAMNLWVDEVRAAYDLGGIKNWSVDYTVEALDTTDFEDSGVKSFIAGPSTWAGSFEGLKDGAPLSIGAMVYLELAESQTLTQVWKGRAFLTGVHATTPADGLVEYSYDFQGTGDLTAPTA